MTLIKTPDQRLRVFISSTIQELAAERKVVREVVERMKLTPVFFESGARPHPPRELYRSYLEQSDVFVGIYWKSYGWIAPDMEISGLEDEWQSGADKPRLIYVKKAEERDPQLKSLLQRIQESNTACYQRFENADDLSVLLANDLAVLLTERFQSTTVPKESVHTAPKTNLPVQRTPIVGRAREISAIKGKFGSGNTGLVTLTGPGGTGKTRLALELGKELQNQFGDGVFFVGLASITEHEKLPGIIAQNLGMINKGNADLTKWLTDYLSDKHLLLILDNLEQMRDAGMVISAILSKCERIKILATSRTPLYIRSENIFPVEPLEIRPFEENKAADKQSGAVDLFMQRAVESNPAIRWNEENRKAAYSICRKLDGLPLGIELAAARCRFYSPEILDKKMDKILKTMNSGPRDYPERQQTLRNTIQWSYDLLEASDQRLFRRLSVFENGWSNDAAEEICWKAFAEPGDLPSGLEHLSDYGLAVNMQTETGYKSQRLLQVIKEFAQEKLVEAGEDERVRSYHCQYYEKLADSNARQIWLAPVSKFYLSFREDYENIVAAFNYAVETDDRRKIWSLVNSLNALYLVTGEIGFLFQGLEKAEILSDEESIKKTLGEFPKADVTMGLLSAGFIRSTTGNFIEGLRDLEVSRRLAREAGIPKIESQALMFLGIAHITIEQFEKARELLLESVRIAKENNFLAVELTAELTLTEVFVEDGAIDKAEKSLDLMLSRLQAEFMPLVESYAYYRRAYLHYYLKEYEDAENRFKQSVEVNRKYSLNLNASFPLLGLAMAYTEMDNKELAMSNFQAALASIRLSGSNVEYECFKYALCRFLTKSGQMEKALRLYAFIKKEYKNTRYRPWITHRVCLDYAEAELLTAYDASYIASRIDNAGELAREEIYAMVKSA